MNVWKRVFNTSLFFITFISVTFVIDGFLFKFGFNETSPSIYDTIPGAIGGTLASIFFVKNNIKKSDICFLIILIILAVVVYFLFLIDV